jgi:hypothetical protein
VGLNSVGLFQHKQHSDKKSPIVEVYESEKNFFDEAFREDIKNHARAYFDEIIQQNVVIFKQDLDAAAAEISGELRTKTVEHLDATIAKVNSELKEHATKQLDDRFVAYGKEMKDAQDTTLVSLGESAKVLEGQYQDFSTTVQKSIANQNVMIHGVFEENMARMVEMKEEQASALQTIQKSAQALETQYRTLGDTLEKTVTDQQERILATFQDNMAQVVEHYLLGALGDQYDLKAQLPSIIKQMEANKDAMMKDMKL